MGRRKEGRRAGSCSRVIKIIWIIWLFLSLCVCIHIHLGRCWYAIGEYNEIWRRSPLIVKNTCGSYVCFVQFSQCIRIMVHGMQRFKEIAPSASHRCVCMRGLEKLLHHLHVSHKSNCIGNAQLRALFWYAIDGFSARLYNSMCILGERGVCLSLELIKQKVCNTLYIQTKRGVTVNYAEKVNFSWI